MKTLKPYIYQHKHFTVTVPAGTEVKESKFDYLTKDCNFIKDGVDRQLAQSLGVIIPPEYIAVMKTLKIGRQTYLAETFAKLSKIYACKRDESGEGASTWPNGKILDENGKQTHYVSYNGKIFEGKTYVSGAQPVYNPYQ